MKIKVFQKGFNYSQDGEGNRLVYHLQGCNMKCRWCANPEGMSIEGALFAEPEWLINSVCPKGAIKDKKVNRAFCNECLEKNCITEHKSKGIRLSFQEYEVKDIIEEITSSSPMFYDNGGVTFTGGEPTLQFEALFAVLREVKKQGINTAIESNGSNPRLEELFPYIDQLIMDCKQLDEVKHIEATGISNKIIKENIIKACRQHPKVHIRVPVIGGVNDSYSDMQAFVEFFDSIKGDNVTFEVLAYHEFGKMKWEQCGYQYTMKDGFVPPDKIKLFQKMIIDKGLNYKRT